MGIREYIESKRKERLKRKKNRWYSGWAVFLWAIFFWPGAIFYLIIKGNQKDLNKRK